MKTNTGWRRGFSGERLNENSPPPRHNWSRQTRVWEGGFRWEIFKGKENHNDESLVVGKYRFQYMYTYIYGGQCLTTCFTQKKKPSTCWIGNTVFYKEDLDILKDTIISCLLRDSKPGPSNPQRTLYTYYVIPVHIRIKYTVNSYSEFNSHDFKYRNQKFSWIAINKARSTGFFLPCPPYSFLLRWTYITEIPM